MVNVDMVCRIYDSWIATSWSPNDIAVHVLDFGADVRVGVSRSRCMSQIFDSSRVRSMDGLHMVYDNFLMPGLDYLSFLAMKIKIIKVILRIVGRGSVCETDMGFWGRLGFLGRLFIVLVARFKELGAAGGKIVTSSKVISGIGHWDCRNSVDHSTGNSKE